MWLHKTVKSAEGKRSLQRQVASAKEQALQQQELLKPSVSRLAAEEDRRGGLVIVKAAYGNTTSFRARLEQQAAMFAQQTRASGSVPDLQQIGTASPEEWLDVTVALQFLVIESEVGNDHQLLKIFMRLWVPDNGHVPALDCCQDPSQSNSTCSLTCSSGNIGWVEIISAIVNALPQLLDFIVGISICWCMVCRYIYGSDLTGATSLASRICMPKEVTVCMSCTSGKIASTRWRVRADFPLFTPHLWRILCHSCS